MLGKRTITLYPNELRGKIDVTAEPTVEGLAATSSFNESLSAGDQVTDVLDMDNRAAVAIATAGVDTKPRIDIALQKRLKADFCIIDGLNTRAVYPAAVRNLLGIYYDTTATWGSATEVVANAYVAGLLGKGRPRLDYNGSSDYAEANIQPIVAYPFTMGGKLQIAQVVTAVAVSLVDKDANNIQYTFRINMGGEAEIGARNTTSYFGTSTGTYNDGEEHTFLAVFTGPTTRELFIDGVSVATDDNSVALSAALDRLSIGRFGDASPSQYFKGGIGPIHIWNRALSAAEAVSYHSDPDNFLTAADRGASKTELMPNQVDRDLSGVSAWTNVDWDSYDEITGAVLTLASVYAGEYCTLPVASAPMTPGKRYRYYYDAASILLTIQVQDFTGTQTFGTISANGTQDFIEFIVDAGITGGFRLVAGADNAAIILDNFSLIQSGCVAAYGHDGISEDQGKLVDGSGNDYHLTVTGADYHDVPEGDSRGFLLVKFDEVEAPDWFLQLNELGKTALAGKNLEVTQVCQGKSLTLSGVKTFHEKADHPGIHITEAIGGAEIPSVRYEGERKTWDLTLVAQTWDQVEDMRRVWHAQEGKKWPFYLEEVWEGEDPQIYFVKFVGPLKVIRTGDRFRIRATIKSLG